MNILHVFDGYDKVADYLGDMRCTGDVVVKYQYPQIITRHTRMDFLVLESLADCIKIAGNCYQMVFYHYDAPQNVRSYVLARLRGHHENT